MGLTLKWLKVSEVHIMSINYPLSDRICLRWTVVDLNL